MAKIRYVGKKERKEDNVAKTGVVWYGHNDVQDVPAAAVHQLLKYPDTWVLDTDESLPPADDTKPPEGDPLGDKNAMTEADARPPMANLDTMDKAQLKEYAQRHFGHTFHHNAGEEKMRQDIIGLMNRG